MSGGSMEYLHRRVREASFDARTPIRRAFKKHLELVAEALHDIEWVDSGDCAPGDEEAAIRAVLHSGAELEAAVELAGEAEAALAAALARAVAALPGRGK